MLSFMKQKFYDLSIRTKYVLVLYSSMLLLLLFFAAILLVAARRNAHRETINSAAKSAAYSNLIVEKEQQYLYGMAAYYAITEEVQKLICDSNNGVENLHLSETVLDFSQRQNHVLSLVFYNQSGNVIDYFSIDNSCDAINQDPSDPTRALCLLTQGQRSYLWEYIPRHASSFMEYDGSPKLCLWHVVPDSSTQVPIGALAITVDSRKLFPERNTIADLNDNIVIIDTRKNLAFGQSPMANTLSDQDVINLIDHMQPYANSGDFQIHIGSKNYCTAYSKIQGSNLVSFSIIEERGIFDNISTVLIVALIGILFCGISILPILFIVTNFLTRPLNQLATSMARFRMGDLSTRVNFRGHDEIGQLGRIFDEIVQENKRLIEESYLLTIQTQEAELAKLQAQINPHFIYNTLNALQWTAIDKGELEISEMAYSIGQVFRLSLNGGQEFISVSAERELLYFYLPLQEKRFKDRLSYKLDFAPETLACMIPKLIIQPLVENSSVHGASNADSHISITVDVTRPSAQQLCIVVADNGAGIPPDILRLLPDKLEKDSPGVSSHSHFALRNISKRLALYYGNNYQFQIESAVGKGTTITIVLPSEPPKR